MGLTTIVIDTIDANAVGTSAPAGQRTGAHVDISVDMLTRMPTAAGRRLSF